MTTVLRSTLQKPRSRRETYSGSTTLDGVVRNSKGGLKLQLGDGTNVRLTGNLAKPVSDQGLFEIDGVATWDVATNAPLTLRIANSKPISLVDPFASLAMATKAHWDGSDAMTHLNRIRGSDE